ncbi:hypothetical protein SOVF_107690 [Spinacia oleracea]|nr:hypothetical protein SOVF_107690 [Spinacia oleracea]
MSFPCYWMYLNSLSSLGGVNEGLSPACTKSRFYHFE